MSVDSFASIPAWAYEGKAPGVLTFFEAVALAGLEDKPIRLDAATQRALLGFPVFGRRSITVHSSGEVSSVIRVCFGTDYERAVYQAGQVARAATTGKQLKPGTSGRRYL